MKKTFAILTVLLAGFLTCPAAPSPAEPDGTYLFARKDGTDLMLDIYEPDENSRAIAGSESKPTVLFLFGGGFRNGSRDKKNYREWFAMLNAEGYRVVSIDYRLGLKDATGAGKNLSFIKQLDRAIGMAVEDLMDATKYLIDNAGQLGIDPSGIVVSGSSAGAMTAMQAEWLICNSSEKAGILPDGFNYAGVMSFAGAVFSTKGKVKYPRKPCPMLMLHGTSDKIVEYDRIKFLNLCLAGTNAITGELEKSGHIYRTYRFVGNGHEIADNMIHNFKEEIDFLENSVSAGSSYKIDATVTDPGIEIPDWAKGDFKDLYK